MLFEMIFIVAMAAQSVTAALAAGRRNMDWVGVCLLACITALGGGSARDVLLGHYPLGWIEHPIYLAVTTGAALATIALARWVHYLRHTFLFLDAVGLVFFSIIGCNVALEMGVSPPIVIIAGMITGTAGGVFRDVLCNEVPLLFRAELYASVSVVTGGLYIGGMHAGFDANLSATVATTLGLAMRLAAIRFGWEMPKFVYTRELH